MSCFYDLHCTIMKHDEQKRNWWAYQKSQLPHTTLCPLTSTRWIETKINYRTQHFFCVFHKKWTAALKLTAKSTNLTAISSNRQVNLLNQPPTAATWALTKFLLSLKVTTWSFGYEDKANTTKTLTNKVDVLQNLSSYTWSLCCDVMGLSNLITVPDWLCSRRFAVIWG